MNQDVAQLLGDFLKGAEQHLWDWPDDCDVPVLRMDVTARVQPTTQPLQDLEPLQLSIEDSAEDDAVLPNQQIIAQELLCRVLIITGRQP